MVIWNKQGTSISRTRGDMPQVLKQLLSGPFLVTTFPIQAQPKACLLPHLSLDPGPASNLCLVTE